MKHFSYSKPDFKEVALGEMNLICSSPELSVGLGVPTFSFVDDSGILYSEE